LGDLDPENVIEQSSAYGMTYGVAISTQTEDSRSVAGFSHNEREFSDDEIGALTTEVEALHTLTRSSQGWNSNCATSCTSFR
jgi:LuxR family transcriptional regulator